MNTWSEEIGKNSLFAFHFALTFTVISIHTHSFSTLLPILAQSWSVRFRRMFPILLLLTCGLTPMAANTIQIMSNTVHLWLDFHSYQYRCWCRLAIYFICFFGCSLWIPFSVKIISSLQTEQKNWINVLNPVYSAAGVDASMSKLISRCRNLTAKLNSSISFKIQIKFINYSTFALHGFMAPTHSTRQNIHTHTK